MRAAQPPHHAPAGPYPASAPYPAAAADAPASHWNQAPAYAPPPAPVSYGAPSYAYPPHGAGYAFGFTCAPGARVHVTWSNGQRYPGTIHQVVGAQCLVVFPDGQQHWVDMQYVAPA